MKNYFRLFTFCLLITASTGSFAQYQINGNAASEGGGCYQLTPNTGNQHGSVWNTNRINLNFPFDFTFNVYLGCSNGGADGICFGLQPASAGIGSTGNGMGMGGISPSLGVFIDTYQNTGDGDPTYDHISINSNGNISHNNAATNLAGPVQASSTAADIENCAYHTLRVRWDPATLTYTVWFDGVVRLNLVGNDIVNTIFGGNSDVFWGFTGSTGGSTNLQQFCVVLVSNFANTTVCQGVATTFADSSYSGSGISNWKWNFGDGSPVLYGGIPTTYQNPTHTYVLPGVYTVQLTIYNSGTDSSTISHNVTVYATPVVTASGATTICSGQSVNIAGTVTGGTPTYSWSPTSNMTNSNTLTPSVTPAVTTTYTLTALNSPLGCRGRDSVTVTVVPAANATFSYVNSPFCVNASNPSPTFTGVPSAGFFSSTAGLVIDTNTGVVDIASSTPGTYIVSDSVPASGPCPYVIGTASITISPILNSTFNYTATSFCSGGANPLPIFIGNGIAGTFSSTAGLVFISTSTGQIDVVNSVPGTYNITNTVTSPGCTNSTTTVTITITSQTPATFTYASPFCQNGSNPSPNFTGGGVAGIFTSTSGLVIDSITGTINLFASTAGTYIVTNTVPGSGGCSDATASSSVTITAVPVATFSYVNNPYCDNGGNPLPTYSGGGVAGTFSSTAGLVFISTANGMVDVVNSNAGTYNITNTIPQTGGCPATTFTSPITIRPAPVATFSYTGTPYCQTGTNPSPTFSGGGIAGIFSSTPGLAIDSITGTVDLMASTPGTYTVLNTIPASAGCSLVFAPTTITIDAANIGTFSYVNTPYCQAAPNPLPTFSGGGIAGVFSSTAGLVFISTGSGQVDVANSVPGTYTVTNTLPANACPSGSASSSITIVVTPIATFSYTGSPYCQSTATPAPVYSGGGVAGTFSSTSGLTINASTGVITLSTSTPGTYTVTNTIASTGGCPAITATSTVTINPVQVGTFGYPATTFCNTGTTSPINIVTSGGTFSAGSGLSISSSTGTINLATSTVGTYTVTYTTAGPCAGTGTAVVNVAAAPTANAGADQTIDCHVGTLTLNGSGSSSGGTISYAWTTSNGNIVSGANTLSPVVNQAGTYTLTVTNSTTPNCPSTDVVVVTGSQAPVASFSANPTSGTPPLTVNFTNNSTNATSYTWAFPGGTPNSSTQTNATVTYANTGNYTAYLYATNGSGCTGVDSMRITVYDGYSLVVPNVFSPNGDGVNDFFTVSAKGVESMEATIYDRWGLKIFTWSDINSGWDGHSSTGQASSDGTYYYIIVTKGADGSTHEDKGFISLLR